MIDPLAMGYLARFFAACQPLLESQPFRPSPLAVDFARRCTQHIADKSLRDDITSALASDTSPEFNRRLLLFARIKTILSRINARKDTPSRRRWTCRLWRAVSGVQDPDVYLELIREVMADCFAPLPW